ncbi:hypothetical protein Droror1_Dr00010078 [Drosera rotundifolia]
MEFLIDLLSQLPTRRDGRIAPVLQDIPSHATVDGVISSGILGANRHRLAHFSFGSNLGRADMWFLLQKVFPLFHYILCCALLRSLLKTTSVRLTANYIYMSHYVIKNGSKEGSLFFSFFSSTVCNS